MWHFQNFYPSIVMFRKKYGIPKYAVSEVDQAVTVTGTYAVITVPVESFAFTLTL